MEETKKRNKSVSQGDGFSQGYEVPGRRALSLQLPVYSRALTPSISLLKLKPCGDVMIVQHGRLVYEAIPHLWSKGDSDFSSVFIIT